jgi:hypothetical protein
MRTFFGQTGQPKPKINRKGVEAKRGTSRAKSSKNYQKPYRGQGRGR